MALLTKPVSFSAVGLRLGLGCLELGAEELLFGLVDALQLKHSAAALLPCQRCIHPPLLCVAKALRELELVVEDFR